LSVEQLKESLQETREAIKGADIRKVLPESELKNYWQEMRDIAQRENVSLIGVSGALTLHTCGKMGTVSRGALTGVQVAGGMFRRNIIGHYVDSLKAVKEKGFYQTIRVSSAPYIQAVWNNFSAEKSTWTQELVTGRAFGRAYNAVKGMFSRSQKTDGSENTAAAEPTTNNPDADSAADGSSPETQSDQQS